jgi:hypothetical protein
MPSSAREIVPKRRIVIVVNNSFFICLLFSHFIFFYLIPLKRYSGSLNAVNGVKAFNGAALKRLRAKDNQSW